MERTARRDAPFFRVLSRNRNRRQQCDLKRRRIQGDVPAHQLQQRICVISAGVLQLPDG